MSPQEYGKDLFRSKICPAHLPKDKRPEFPLKFDKINQTTYLIWEGECCVAIIAAPKKIRNKLNGYALCAMLASEKLAKIEGPT